MTDAASVLDTRGEMLGKVDLAIARIESAPVEELAETLDTLESLKRRVKELDECAKRNMTARIQASGKTAIEVGSDLWVLKHPKTVKCRDAARTFNTVMELAGGDMEAMVRDYFASSPFKYGAIREALQDEGTFNELFETKVDTTVEKKPVKLDKKFIR